MMHDILPTLPAFLRPQFQSTLLLAAFFSFGLPTAALAQVDAEAEQAAPQAEDSKAPLPPEIPMGQWMPLDRVMLVANTDCLTMKALERMMNRSEAMTGTDTEEEYQALRNRVLIDSIDSLLSRQAGEDLGLDSNMVSAQANMIWDDRVAQVGGITSAARELGHNSETVTDMREQITDDLYSSTWRRQMLGRESGSGERLTHDRFSRPGQLRQRYKRLQETGLDVVKALGGVGGKAAHYEVQVLLLNPRQFDSGEAALNKARDLRAGLEQGELDWEEALETFGSLAQSSQAPDRESLIRILDPGNGALVRFVDEAEEGQYSQVLGFAPMDTQGQRQLQGFAIYKLLGRTPAQVPDFGQPGVQIALKRFIDKQRDNQRFETSLAELRAKAYLWYPGLELEQAEARARNEAREQEILEAREQNATQEAPSDPSPGAQ
jgi:hypothetical protein